MSAHAAQAPSGPQILVPSSPRHLRVTQTMVDDFIIDPVLGAKVIMGIEMDAFQAARLRTYWWVPNVMDSSAVGTAKTMTFWIFLNLRSVLIGDQVCLAYYQTFDAGKRVFWPYYRLIRHPLFRAQLGKLDVDGDSDGKSNSKGPACWTQHFRNDSQVQMPAPNWVQEAVGQAGLDINVAGLDEWTKATKIGTGGDGADGINSQILARVRRKSFNQYHPLWGNHTIFMGSAESPQHPAYKRYEDFQRQIRAGNPEYAHVSFSFKDYSNLRCYTGRSFKSQFRNERMYANLKAQETAAGYRRQALGLWSRETKTWYSEEQVQKCIDLGKGLGTGVECSRTGTEATQLSLEE